jgi:hypothetical protein
MKLTAPKRAALPKKDFAGGGRKGSKGFPMPDKEHARLAISGATRSEHAGNISAGKAEQIKAKAHKMLGGGLSHSEFESLDHGGKHDHFKGRQDPY